MRRSFARLLLALCCAGALLPKSAFAQDAVAEFYRGRQVNLIIGYGPGGGYDTAARLFKLPPRNAKQADNLRRFGNLAA